MYLGYYETQQKAIIALSEYNSSPYDITRKTITFERVYHLWSVDH